MNKAIIISIVVILMLSCGETEKKYIYHYDNDKLVGVLVDLYISEAALKSIKGEAKDSVSMVYRQQISQIHNVDMNKIDQDIAELQSNLDLYKELQQKVEKQLKEMSKSALEDKKR